MSFLSRAYLSEAPFRYSSLGYAPDLTHKHLTRMERLAKDKQSSLLPKSVITDKKSFITLGPGLMFAGEAGAYPTDGPFRCTTLGYFHGLNHKH
jgi:hypothetical protein